MVSQELKVKNKEVIFIATNKKEYLNNLWSRNINKRIINYEDHEFSNKNNKFLLIGIGDVDIYFDKKLNNRKGEKQDSNYDKALAASVAVSLVESELENYKSI